MVRIIKTNEPTSLRRAINKGAVDFETDLDGRTRVKLRTKLLEDQGYVCCYCLKKIPEKFIPKSKIEHFLSQTNHPNSQLDFRNLFIACNGLGNNKGFTCDTKKANSDILSFNLLTTNLNQAVRYTKNGNIFSVDPDIKNEIESVLNLNDENLRKTRQEILLAIERIKRKCNSRGSYASNLQKVIDEWSSRDTFGKYKSFYAVGLYYLNKS